MIFGSAQRPVSSWETLIHGCKQSPGGKPMHIHPRFYLPTCAEDVSEIFMGLIRIHTGSGGRPSCRRLVTCRASNTVVL